MPAKIELIVGLVKVAGGHDKFRLVVALKAGARGNVENSVSAVAVIRRVAAPLRLQRIDFPRIDLRAKIAGDIRVRYRDAVNEPAHLMAATNMKLIMREVSTRHVVGDHRQAVSSRRTRSSCNLRAIDHAGWRDGFRLSRSGFGGHNDRLHLRGQLQLKV